MYQINEQQNVEQVAIEFFYKLGYEFFYGPDVAPNNFRPLRKNYQEVLIEEKLRQALRRINPFLDEKAIEETILTIKKLDKLTLDDNNRLFYQYLQNGVIVKTEKQNKSEIARIIDFKNPENNDFFVINQFTVEGKNIRKPDLVVFVNGLPLAVFEFKHPFDKEISIKDAFKQIDQKYKKDIPDLFFYNQIIVVSDTFKAKYGTINTSWERFSTWKIIEKEGEKLKEGITELEVLIRGIFNKKRFLDILENFIVFEADSEKDTAKYTKKICYYHQYYAVNQASENTLKAIQSDKKIGVLWHTQGSGKSLSMVFYVNKTKKIPQLKSPTYVFLTDRNDLDDQLYKTFLRCSYHHLAKKVTSTEDLKQRLKNPQAEIIFTTIQKFQGKDYPLLSEKENIIVIADEAHRSEYAKLAANVRIALPNASFMGITGTPISLNNRDTRLVFGNYISQYTIDKAVEDGATVPIYYQSRLVPLHLTNYFIDDDYDQLMAEYDLDVKESLKKKFANLEKLVLAEDRISKIVSDIYFHFKNHGIKGKAMITTISREGAIKYYRHLRKYFEKNEIAVVISNIIEFKDELDCELNIKETEKNFKNPESNLKIVVVCDMWLTGFDAPSLEIIYFDKPLKNHTLLQAIARVNRVYKDKPGGLIVDYIGIADDIKKALGEFVFDKKLEEKPMISLEELVNKMNEKLDVVRSMFFGINYQNWKNILPDDFNRLVNISLEKIITDEKLNIISEEKKKRFLKEVSLLIKLFAFVMPHQEAYKIKDEVEFFELIKKRLVKNTNILIDIDYEHKETVVKQLISKSIKAEGILDILKLKDKIDFSILNEKFIEEIKNSQYRNLSIEAIRKLIEEKIKIKIRKNYFRYKKFSDLLDELIEKYEDRLINSSKILDELIKLAQEISNTEESDKKLGMSEEEIALYEVIKKFKIKDLKNGKLKELIKELVRILRRDIAIDWENSEIIKARIRANIKLILLKNNFPLENIKKIMENIYQQIKYLWNSENFFR